MNPIERSGGESAVPNRSQAALDNWQNVQINRRCSPRRGYRSARYHDIAINRDFTIPPPISPFSEYVDYNKEVILLAMLLNQSRRIKPGALLAEAPTASIHMVALQISSALWNGSNCYKRELLLFKK
jgi:hypothetical protein